MRFQVPAFEAAIFLTILAVGALGMFVLVPIAFIQWSWNSIMTNLGLLPSINAWQALLLYLAATTALFLSGFVRVKFDTRHL